MQGISYEEHCSFKAEVVGNSGGHSNVDADLGKALARFSTAAGHVSK